MYAPKDKQDFSLDIVKDVLTVGKKGGAPTISRFKYFAFELYPDCEYHMSLMHLLKYASDFDIVYILHDKDIKEWTDSAPVVLNDDIKIDIGNEDLTSRVNTEGTLEYAVFKKPHYHIMLKCKTTSMTKKAFAKKFCEFAPVWWQKIDGEFYDTIQVADYKAYLRYLIHRTFDSIKDGKAEYSIDDLVTNSAFWVDEINRIEDTKSCSQVAFIQFMRSIMADKPNKLDARIRAMQEGFFEFTLPKYDHYFNSIYNECATEYGLKAYNANDGLNDLLKNQYERTISQALKYRCKDFKFLSDSNVARFAFNLNGAHWRELLADMMTNYAVKAFMASPSQDFNKRVDYADNMLDIAFNKLAKTSDIDILATLKQYMTTKTDFDGFSRGINKLLY